MRLSCYLRSEFWVVFWNVLGKAGRMDRRQYRRFSQLRKLLRITFGSGKGTCSSVKVSLRLRRYAATLPW